MFSATVTLTVTGIASDRLVDGHYVRTPSVSSLVFPALPVDDAVAGRPDSAALSDASGLTLAGHG